MAQNRKFQDFIETNMLQTGAVSTAKIADNAVTEPKVGGQQIHTLKFVYDGSSLTAGAKTLTGPAGEAQTLPAGAIVVDFMIDADVPFASSGSATIALGITGTADAFLGATAFDNAALVRATSHFKRPSGTSIIGGASSVLLTIATAALTAGGASVYINYIETV